VRYESTAPPDRGTYCHCTMCQKNYGGLFSATVRFAGSTFAIRKGRPKYYRSSAFGQRGFCAECGSPMVFLYDGSPNVRVLFGSLDHHKDWPLTKDAAWGQTEHVFIKTKVSWYEVNDGLQQNVSDREALAR
jgi:hypothetical protein